MCSKETELKRILNRIPIFGGITADDLNKIIPKMEEENYSAGSYIFKQDTPPSHIYIIREGRVDISVDKEGSSVKLASFDVGDCFGETAVIGIQPHIANSIAVTDTKLFVLSRETLFSLYKDAPCLFGLLLLNISREICRRLESADEMWVHYAYNSHKPHN